MRVRRRQGRALAPALLALIVAGCAGTSPPRTPVAPTALVPAPDGAVPWELPLRAFGRQYLLRSEAQGSEGELRLRLSLLLAGPERWALRAADTFGRAVWSLDLAGQAVLAVDHRAGRWCRRLVSDWEEPMLAFGEPFGDPSALPPILLGRLPSTPLHPPAATQTKLDYVDADGRRLTAELDAGDRLPLRWTAWRDGEPAMWWRRTEGGGELVVRGRSLKVRWQLVVDEPLGPDALSEALPMPPSGISEERCDGMADRP